MESLLEVFPHLLELDSEPLEAHELVGDALREGPDGGVLDVPEEVLDADLLGLLGANLGLHVLEGLCRRGAVVVNLLHGSAEREGYLKCTCVNMYSHSHHNIG